MKKFSESNLNSPIGKVNESTLTHTNEAIEHVEIKNMLYHYINSCLTIATYGAYDPYLVGQVEIAGKDKLIEAITNWLVSNQIIKEDNSFVEDMAIYEELVSQVYDPKLILDRMHNLLNSNIAPELKNKMYQTLNSRDNVLNTIS